MIRKIIQWEYNRAAAKLDQFCEGTNQKLGKVTVESFWVRETRQIAAMYLYKEFLASTSEMAKVLAEYTATYAASDDYTTRESACDKVCTHYVQHMRLARNIQSAAAKHLPLLLKAHRRLRRRLHAFENFNLKWRTEAGKNARQNARHLLEALEARCEEFAAIATVDTWNLDVIPDKTIRRDCEFRVSNINFCGVSRPKSSGYRSSYDGGSSINTGAWGG